MTIKSHLGCCNNESSLETTTTEDVASKDGLTLHIVGAKSTEVDDVTIWEIVPLHLRNLRRLTVVFIGPQLRLIKYLSNSNNNHNPNIRIAYRYFMHM